MKATNDSDLDEWISFELEREEVSRSAGGKAVAEFRARQKREKEKETQLKVDQQYDASQLSNQGVQKDDYDFNKMHEEEGGFTSGPEGSILKNKYRAPLKEEVAGFDISTGINERNTYMDFDGHIADAIKMLTSSTVNSATGERPKEDIYPLSKIAYESMVENVDFLKFKKQVNQWPEGDLSTAWKSAQRLQDAHGYEDYYKTGSWKKEQEEVDKTIRYSELSKTPKWIDSARYFLNDYTPGLAESLGKEELTDEEISKEAYTLMSHFNWNLTAQAIMAVRVGSSDDIKVKQAFYNMMSAYDQVDYEGFEEHAGGVLRGAGGIVSDPLTYAGMGLGTVIIKSVAKKKLGSAAFRPILNAMIGAAPEGGFYGGFDSYNRQKVEIAAGARKEISAKKVVTDTAIGAAAGSTVVGALGVGGKAVKKSYGYLSDRLGKAAPDNGVRYFYPEDLDEALAHESKFELDRAQQELPPWGGKTESVQEGGSSIRQFFGNISTLAKTKTEDILKAGNEAQAKGRTAESPMTPEMSESFNPETLADIEAVTRERIDIAQFAEERSKSKGRGKSSAEKIPDVGDDPAVDKLKREKAHKGAADAMDQSFTDIKDAEDMGAMLDRLAKQMGGRGSRTFKDIKKNVSSTADVFRELEPVYNKSQKGLMTDRQSYASMVMRKTLFNNIVFLSNKISKGDAGKATQLAYNKAEAQFFALSAYTKNNATELGRALNAQKLANNAAGLGTMADMEETIRGQGGPELIRTKAKLMEMFAENQADEGGNVAQRYAKIFANGFRLGSGAVGEFFTAQILTGGKTLSVNAMGLPLMNMWDNLLIQPMAAVSGHARNTVAKAFGKDLKGDFVSGEEVAGRLTIGVMTARDTLGLMWRALKRNESVFGNDLQKNDVVKGDMETVLGKVMPDTWAKNATEGLTPAFRVLTAVDEGKAIGYRQELLAQNIQQARKEGLKGQAKWDRVKELQDTPTQEVHNAAVAFAKRQTFQEEGGRVISGLRRAAKSAVDYLPMLKVITPFIKTPLNMLARAQEMSPLALAANGVLKDLLAGGAKADVAMAKVTAGAGLGAVVWHLYEAGIVTGPGPENREIRKAMQKEGWQPLAIKVGDTHYGMQRLSPFTQPMAIYAAYLDKAKYANTEKDFIDATLMSFFTLADNMQNQTFLKGLQEVMDASTGNGYAGMGKAIAADRMSSMFPYSGLSKTIKDLVDPQPRATMKDSETGLAELTWQKMKAKLPYLSLDMQPHRYWDGTASGKGQAGTAAYALSPVVVGKRSEFDRENQELLAQHAVPPQPRKLVNVAGMEFSLVELDNYKGEIYGAYFKKVGKYRRMFLKELFSSAEYKNIKSQGPDSDRAHEISNMINAAEKAARGDFLFNDLRELLVKAGKDRSGVGDDILNRQDFESWVEHAYENYEEDIAQKPEYEKKVKKRGYNDNKRIPASYKENEKQMELQMGPLN